MTDLTMALSIAGGVVLAAVVVPKSGRPVFGHIDVNSGQEMAIS